jgi:hypothetical protein
MQGLSLVDLSGILRTYLETISKNRREGENDDALILTMF